MALCNSLPAVYASDMNERVVSLDSLRVDAIFASHARAISALDDDLETFVKRTEVEVEITLADAEGTLLAVQALSRRLSIDR